MELPQTTRKYSEEEKSQLIANLDIEVEHKLRQFESWLEDTLEQFRIHQEGQILRVPKLVRGITMGVFTDKYNGDVQECLRGLQKEKMGSEAIEIDQTTRKRKWVASQEEAESSANGAAHEAERALKNARMTVATPKKKPGSSMGPGTAQRARLLSANKTPGTSRTFGRIPPVPPSPSPNKFATKPSSLLSRLPARLPSPSKASQPRNVRPPSSSTFNPVLPKGPVFPSVRVPRRDESMLSLNGSPLANPYQLGLGWFAGTAEDNMESDNAKVDRKGKKPDRGSPKPLRKTNSIVIRRDPSVAFSSSSSTANVQNGLHSRTNSRNFISSTQPSESNSQAQHQSQPQVEATPKRMPIPLGSSSSQSQLTALVAIPTKDGHMLEFDPLQTSPGALDALEGITDSAKKQAKEEMGRLVQAAVAKWKIA
ncbi:hypothetical protein SERLA73DRAFT_109266 [Serpula lacrymans var. lacrymans S7.3]|uniref:Uncharacterized protein n=2 Tax=Serpula lacrymans var. lacrymans TaxID=341189 RepID=F8Q101_SERL3|nr:uncharacterized protein SERLADRAFT_449920 [Serpula lacrymans var. lacrymans S7.9]EGN97979.1 hypothetical protein SERLA73DRAFT_109266 [Serpula lacrymans var. lacrymans S7.3]EGO23570.1 hypothetical protein SERLADRAFT_449920 [Serpula lacrymans var. lacrymans S7.9]